MKKTSYPLWIILILSVFCPPTSYAQKYFSDAFTNVEHLVPTSITVTYSVAAAEWDDEYKNIITDKSHYTIIDLTEAKHYSPGKIELDTLKKHGNYEISATIYIDEKYLPGHQYLVQWNNDKVTLSSQDTLVFTDCIQEKKSDITIKPILASSTVALDFNFANNIFTTNDMLIKWNVKGYIDFGNKDSLSTTEINAECTYPISSARPHPFFIGKLGGDFDGHFTSADLKVSAGVSFLDQYILPPVIKFLSNELFHASMPIPPPVLAVFGEAGLPWSRTTGIQDSVMWRLAGEINVNVPLGNGNFLNMYARGWILTKNDSKSFIEFAYKKQVTQNVNIVLQWLNGALPPIFQNGSSVRAGVSFIFPTL